MILIFLILSQFCFFEPLQFFPLSIILQYYETSFILYANNCFLFLIRLIYIYIYIYIYPEHIYQTDHVTFFSVQHCPHCYSKCVSAEFEFNEASLINFNEMGISFAFHINPMTFIPQFLLFILPLSLQVISYFLKKIYSI